MLWCRELQIMTESWQPLTESSLDTEQQHRSQSHQTPVDQRGVSPPMMLSGSCQQEETRNFILWNKWHLCVGSRCQVLMIFFFILIFVMEIKRLVQKVLFPLWIYLIVISLLLYISKNFVHYKTFFYICLRKSLKDLSINTYDLNKNLMLC